MVERELASYRLRENNVKTKLKQKRIGFSTIVFVFDEKKNKKRKTI